MTMTPEERLKALEDRFAQLESKVDAAHGKADELYQMIVKIDKDYYGMMKNALKKYGVLKSFCETAGAIILECDKILFPEKAMERGKRLTFLMQGSEEIN
jgi:hypothetical protein